MKAKELKNKGILAKLGGKEFEIKLNMNTFCELEDLYENPYDLMEALGKGSFKAIRSVVWANYKTVQPDATLSDVGDLISIENLYEIADKILEVTNASLPEAENEIEGE